MKKGNVDSEGSFVVMLVSVLEEKQNNFKVSYRVTYKQHILYYIVSDIGKQTQMMCFHIWRWIESKNKQTNCMVLVVFRLMGSV